jgi:protein SCO1/2
MLTRLFALRAPTRAPSPSAAVASPTRRAHDSGQSRRRYPSARHLAALLTAAAFASLGAGCAREEAPWHLVDVTGHLPDLSFDLTGDNGKPVDAASFKGKTTLVYFGYTHCPDVCPETMARLMQVLAQIGTKDAQQVRILFVSVDPARDTPQALHAYVGAFDAEHARGLTGSNAQIESLAKRYRVAYQMEKRDPRGNYEVTHSSAVYVFDAQGRARLLATSEATPDAIATDLKRLIESPA